MFSLEITDTDAFLVMPSSAQALYFHLGMRADDDGFVAAPKKIMGMCNASEDDMKILIAKRFILTFESGIIVIKHWKIHNYIQNDRYHETKYLEEKNTLELKENGSYTEKMNNELPSPPQNNSSGQDDVTIELSDDLKTPRQIKREEAIGAGSKSHLTKPILQWAEEKIGHKLTPTIKQLSAIKAALTAGFTEEQIKDCWIDLESDEWWSEKGFDFTTVFNQIGKHKAKKESSVSKFY